MSHGIVEKGRDFVFGIVGQGTDWHKLTIEKPTLEAGLFPEIVARDVEFNGQPFIYDGKRYCAPVSTDDNLPVAPPFACDTFRLFTPREGWDYVAKWLSGTGYTVERIGMLWNRSKWFISTHLNELESVQREGNKFQLNFSGGLDRSMSPQAELTEIRAVCWNTLSASRAMGKVLFKEKLTRNFDVRAEKRHEEMEKLVGMAKLFNAAMVGLENIGCDKPKARRIYTGFIVPETDIEGNKTTELSTNAENTVDGLVELFERGAGNTGNRLSDVLNGYTQFATRGLPSKESKKSEMSRFQSSEFGNYANRKAEFATLLFDGGERLAAVEARGAELIKA